jgi:hypothetical protein
MTISIRRDGTTGTRHILKIRNHEIPVDASPAGGGSDAAPIRTTCTTRRWRPARRSRC